MASSTGTKISQLSPVTSLAGDEVIPLNQLSVTDSGTPYQINALLSCKMSARAASTANLNATYSNGTSGVGATLTNAGALAALVIDGVTLVVGDRVLVKNQTTSYQNGIYSVANIGSGIVAWVLTRTTDFDNHISNQILEGSTLSVSEGTINSASQWIETGAGPFTLGTTAIVFTSPTITPGTPFLSWVDQTTSSATVVAQMGYVSNDGASLITYTLPAIIPFGTMFFFVGKASGLWSVAYGAGQSIVVGNITSTVTTGSVSSTNAGDCCIGVCTTADTQLTLFGLQGNLAII